MVEMAVKKLNSGKAPGPSDITAETIKAAGAVGVNHLHSLTNKIITAYSKEKVVLLRGVIIVVSN